MALEPMGQSSEPAPPRVDAHHHLWRYSPEEYGWIDATLPALQRDFLPDEFAGLLRAAGLAGSVVVQARQTLDETHWLLACARQQPAILGVVGWLPLASPNLPALLRSVRNFPALKGLRHIVQDEPDPGFLAAEPFNRGIAQLLDAGLSFDLLVREHQLAAATALARRHPQQRFVLDHLAKPNIRAHALEPWRTLLFQLADCPNVCCKLSGLVTEADPRQWTPADLQPYLDVALTAFGPERLMAGSDWPVCLLATGYARWWATLEAWARPLPPKARALIFGGTATRFYGLAEPARLP